MPLKTRTRVLLLVLSAAILLPMLFLLRYGGSPQLRWRLDLVRLKTLGAIPNEGWYDIARRMLPDRFGGQAFVDVEIVNPMPSTEDIEAGTRLYDLQCAPCHGSRGEGFSGPPLAERNFARRASNNYVFETIARGLPGTNMPAFPLAASELLRLTAFVRQMADKAAEHAAATSICETCKAIDVTYDRLANADRDPKDWITYSGAYQGQRFSALRQIHRGNVSGLRLKWAHQMPRASAGLQTVPLAIDGVLFLTGPDNEVLALDAATGKELWVFGRAVADSTRLCCGRNNRGVAALGNRIFHGTLDNHLIALDMTNGDPLWDVTVADVADGYSMTGAPLALNDKIIVGIAGGEFGVRGFLDAYDPATGKRLWRFQTIPGPGEAGHETWENDAWQTGGGTTWVTGSYDAELNLLYWGVGNPGPLFDGDVRPGDNLYTASVIALNPDNGELQWHYQFVPHDTNDWDAALVPVLADLEYQGAPRKLMLWANRNCFYYVLDRESGQFLQATEYCRQNWNDGFTKEGRPIRRPDSSPSDEGNLTYPGPFGGSNWYSPAYNPTAKLYYVNYRTDDYVIRRTPGEFSRGAPYHSGEAKVTPDANNSGGVRAIDAASGRIVWELRKERHSRAGILTTGAGLVFTGNGDGTLLTLDASTGEVIARLPLGGAIDAGPITYVYEGKQQLAVLAGGSLFVFEAAN
ncbi:MAG: PQQ-dependent dehydrogenase, methanol/ethanol family [Bryobacterales bacterium]